MEENFIYNEPVLLAIGFIILIHCLGFLIAYLRQTDALTDLSYALGFFGAAWISYVLNPKDDLNLLACLCISLWALRLGGYLAHRVHVIGRDSRFDEMRASFLKFGGFWLLQALTIIIMTLPVFFAFPESAPLNYAWVFPWTGVFLIGLVLETVADWQKFQFKKDNPSDFCSIGVWSWCRHPNYLGEILCWWALALMLSDKYTGWAHLAWVSPLWISFLLLKISGIPPLENAWKEKYGQSQQFQDYVKNTPRLIPIRLSLGKKSK